jgi:hypothetical protein
VNEIHSGQNKFYDVAALWRNGINQPDVSWLWQQYKQKILFEAETFEPV